MAQTPTPVYQSSHLNGVFKTYELDPRCRQNPYGLISATLDREGTKPIFIERVKRQGECPWSLATVSEQRITTIAVVSGNLWDSSIAAAWRSGFWTFDDTGYIYVAAGRVTRIGPVVPGFQPVAIATDATGTIYSLESREQTWGREKQFVDLTTRANEPLGTWQDSNGFLQGADGHAYLGIFGGHFSEATPSGPLELPAPEWIGTPAVAADGTLWFATFLGLAHVDRSGKTIQEIGPIGTTPRVVTNTQAYTPASPVVSNDGTVWFLYHGQIWRLTTKNALEKDALPKDVTDARLLPAADGSIWITAAMGEHAAILQFVPVPSPIL